MVDSKVAPVYWQHACPASSLEDGDRKLRDPPEPSRAHQHIEYTKISRKPWKLELEAIHDVLGKKCSAKGCQYTVTGETVIANRDKEPICNIGGKNYYDERTLAYRVRCCKCKMLLAGGHSSKPQGWYKAPGVHSCVHVMDFDNGQRIRPGDCDCVWVNPYGERIRTWEPEGGPKEVVLAGSTLDLENKYLERKKIVEKRD